MERFYKQLANCSSTSEVLTMLLAKASSENLGIESVRYYRLGALEKKEYLVTIEIKKYADQKKNFN